MPRVTIAALAGVFGFIAYVVAVVTLADRLPSGWALQGVYFLVVGIAWVIPARALMLWAARK